MITHHKDQSPYNVIITPVLIVTFLALCGYCLHLIVAIKQQVKLQESENLELVKKISSLNDMLATCNNKNQELQEQLYEKR